MLRLHPSPLPMAIQHILLEHFPDLLRTLVAQGVLQVHDNGIFHVAVHDDPP